MPPALLVSLDADELRPLVGSAHRALGEHPADLVGLPGVRALQGLPHLLLAGVVRIDGEGHQLLQGHAVLGVDLEQRLRHGGQPQALVHDVDRHEEGGGDLLLGLALLTQGDEGAELVERMQGRPLDVLGQAVLLGEAVGADDARDGRGAGKALLLHQQLQRPVAPAAGRHLVHAGLGTAVIEDRPHGQALQQRAPGDVLGQLLDGDAGLDAAHVGLAQHQLVEGDVARNAQGDLGLRLGHGMVSATGRPGATLPASSSPSRKTPRSSSSARSQWRQPRKRRQAGSSRGHAVVYAFLASVAPVPSCCAPDAGRSRNASR